MQGIHERREEFHGPFRQADGAARGEGFTPGKRVVRTALHSQADKAPLRDLWATGPLKV